MKPKRLISAVCALAMTAALVPYHMLGANAEGEKDAATLECIAKDIYGNMFQSDFGYTVSDPANAPEAPAMSKFDLRDVDGKNYVTSVKNQGSYGNCWAFAAIAAAETSMLFEAGYDLNDLKDPSDNIDFSERHLAWFSAVPISEDDAFYSSQAGEGACHYLAETERAKDDPDYKMINTDIFSGGWGAFATTAFSSLQGPCKEELAPYLSGIYSTGTLRIYRITEDPADKEYDDEHPFSPELVEEHEFNSYEELDKLIKGKDYKGRMYFSILNGWYDGEGLYYNIDITADKTQEMDWSVDESLRFSGQQLEHSSLLPPIAAGDPETGAYVFNINGLNAIKNELVSGRAVSVGFRADQSFPGDKPVKGSYVNFVDEQGNIADNIYSAAYWCHYTYDKEYDPNDPNSINKDLGDLANHAVTIVGYDDNFPKEYFYDPNGTIGGDGAFIVKNSWGSEDTYGVWGNNGDGYFYISYYDQSIDEIETFDFSFTLTENTDKDLYTAINPQMYDFMVTNKYGTVVYNQGAMANIFNCDFDQRLYATGYVSTSCNETVTYCVVELDEDYETPEDGELLCVKTETYPYAGYHRVTFDEPMYFKEGTKYAIIVIAQREDGYYAVSFKNNANRKYAEAKCEEKRNDYIMEYGNDEGFLPYGINYSNGVVNKGESYFYAGDEWLEWSEIIDAIHTYAADVNNINEGVFPADKTDFDNFSIQAFTDCEFANVQHTIAEPQDKPYHVGDKVLCSVSVRNDMGPGYSYDVYVNGTKIGTAEFTEDSGDEIEVPYYYIVKEEDLERGYFENTVELKTIYVGVEIRLEQFDAFSTVTVRADVTAEEDTAETEPEGTDQEKVPPRDDSYKPKKEDKPSPTPAGQEGNDNLAGSTSTSNPKTSSSPQLLVAVFAAAAIVVLKKRR